MDISCLVDFTALLIYGLHFTPVYIMTVHVVDVDCETLVPLTDLLWLIYRQRAMSKTPSGSEAIIALSMPSRQFTTTNQ